MLQISGRVTTTLCPTHQSGSGGLQERSYSKHTKYTENLKGLLHYKFFATCQQIQILRFIPSQHQQSLWSSFVGENHYQSIVIKANSISIKFTKSSQPTFITPSSKKFYIPSKKGLFNYQLLSHPIRIAKPEFKPPTSSGKPIVPLSLVKNIIS